MPKSKTGLVGRAALWLHNHRFLDLHGIHGWYGSGWSGGWWPGAILEANTGDWQRNITTAPTQTLLSFSPVFACVTGISSDIAKMRMKLVRNDDGIWKEETANQPWLPLLRNPNDYQDSIKFFESWMLSKLMYGNTYVLKFRDGSTRVNSLYVLHPGCIKPMVAENGDVYYKLERDDLSGITNEFLERLRDLYGEVAIPASEIIHDRMNCLWHPLIGISPLYACANSATLGNSILSNSTTFFQNSSRPGGHLSSPNEISDETAVRLKTAFEANFSGDNRGKLLVTGDGLEFKPFMVDAQDSQLKEQLEGTVDDVARAFRYPRWKLGGPAPPYTKPDEAQTMYYTDCLQSHIESIERCLDNGLELPLSLGTEFDLDGLMRMDTGALYDSNNKAKGWMKLNEQRRRANLEDLKEGGDTVYLQHQDYSVEALAKRDAKDDPFENTNSTTGLPTEPAPTPEPEKNPEPDRSAAEFDVDEFSAEELRRELTLV